MGKTYAGRVRYRPPRIRRSATHPIGHPHDSAVPLAPEEWTFVAQVPAVVSQEQSLDSFYTYTEQHWSVQGYSSAEEMRRSLGSSWLDRARQSDQAAAEN